MQSIPLKINNAWNTVMRKENWGRSCRIFHVSAKPHLTLPHQAWIHCKPLFSSYWVGVIDYISHLGTGYPETHPSIVSVIDIIALYLYYLMKHRLNFPFKSLISKNRLVTSLLNATWSCFCDLYLRNHFSFLRNRFSFLILARPKSFCYVCPIS